MKEVVEESTDAVLHEQKNQLLEGKNPDGFDITPSYFDDPYFKSPESAKRYSDWKDRITPNPKRKKGTPNLFINGRYHNSIEVLSSSVGVTINASFLQTEISNKYGDVLGLNPEHASKYSVEVVAPKGVEKIKFLILK